MKQTIPFTFEEIYKDLEKEFAKLGYDTPFEGSNTAQIITAMAYTISNLNLNTAVNINENLLTLARKRKIYYKTHEFWDMKQVRKYLISIK